MQPTPTRYRFEFGSEKLLPLADLPAALCQILGETVPERTVRNWCSRGVRGHRLPTTLVGNRRRWSEEGLAWWLAAINDELPIESDSEVETEVEAVHVSMARKRRLAKAGLATEGGAC